MYYRPAVEEWVEIFFVAILLIFGRLARILGDDSSSALQSKSRATLIILVRSAPVKSNLPS